MWGGPPKRAHVSPAQFVHCNPHATLKRHGEQLHNPVGKRQRLVAPPPAPPAPPPAPPPFLQELLRYVVALEARVQALEKGAVSEPFRRGGLQLQPCF